MPPRRPALLPALSALWGFAEATLFFIVPDAFFCGVAAAQRIRQAWLCLAAALIGGLLGGTILFQLSAAQIPQIPAIIHQVPGVTPKVIQSVRNQLQQGTLGLAQGGFAFLPYKVYALEAPAQNWTTPGFIAASTIARLSRFTATLLLTILCAKIITHLFPPLNKPNRLVAIHCAFWSAIYLAYFLIIIPNLSK